MTLNGGGPTLAFSRAAPVDWEAIFVDMDAKIASISLDAKRRRLQRDVSRVRSPAIYERLRPFE